MLSSFVFADSSSSKLNENPFSLLIYSSLHLLLFCFVLFCNSDPFVVLQIMWSKEVNPRYCCCSLLPAAFVVLFFLALLFVVLLFLALMCCCAAI
jgi:hypothetical protein